VPDGVYHERVIGVASKSCLDMVRRAPAVYRAWVAGELDDGTGAPPEALAFGRACHCAILEPERFATEYVVAPDFGDCRYKAAKAERDAWRAAHAGRTPLLEADARAFSRMVAAVTRHPIAGPLLRGGRAELTARWRDPATGLECKARGDYYRADLATLVDVKTTSDAGAESFRRSLASYAYHRQHSFYADGFAEAGAPVENFVFVAIEKRPPHLLAVYSLDEDGVERGRASIRRDLETLADCIERDTWPGLPEHIQILTLPPWG